MRLWNFDARRWKKTLVVIILAHQDLEDKEFQAPDREPKEVQRDSDAEQVEDEAQGSTAQASPAAENFVRP